MTKMASSVQTARAINDLLQLSEQDEQNLMEVIEDYFTVREDRDGRTVTLAQMKIMLEMEVRLNNWMK